MMPELLLALPLLAFVLLLILGHAAEREIMRREDRRAAARRHQIATQVVRECNRTRATFLSQRTPTWKPANPTAINWRMDVLRVPGETDAEIVGNLLASFQPRRSEA